MSVGTPQQEAQFWARVDTSGGPDACWPWTGYIATDGYGHRKLDGKGWPAHRLAKAYATGAPIPAGLIVCHHCDNRPCCNPSHLYIGTYSDNNRDTHSRGRWSRWRRGCLSPDQVREVRVRYARGESSIRLGIAYGVAQTTAHRVATGRTFRHIPMPTLEEVA